MPTASEPKLDTLIQNCSLQTAQACFRKLCPGSFERKAEELENSNPERFTQFHLFGEIPFESDRLLFAFTEVTSELTERSCRKAQFDAARTILRSRSDVDAGIFIFRGANGAFRLSFITKIYKGTKAEFSHFRRYTYFVDPATDGNGTFIRQVGSCAFDSLEAIQEAFSVEALNKEFYRELSNWYFWAMRYVHFPTDDLTLAKDERYADQHELYADKQKVREHDAKNLIRLLTRMLFVWFIKQRGLVPNEIFDPETINSDYLKEFDPESRGSNYYKAILQNLFFATLNQAHGKREFRKMGAAHRANTSLMRYQSAFKDTQRFVDAVEAVTPFLNGGLFECLDFLHPTEKGPQGGRKKVYEDGFSDHADNPLIVPDMLFFGDERTADLSGEQDYNDKKRKKESVSGLIPILKRYNFTIVENSPIEQEVALDPELLGKVFENLLASYNPETKTTARKQTGSFYTPRPIVEYMVDESLKAYLLKPLVDEAGMAEADAKIGLDILFSYEEKEMDSCFSEPEVEVLIRAIDRCKILDPACGSGAFPMGILQKLVFVLAKLDRENVKWEAQQIAEAQKIEDTKERRLRICEIGQDFLDNGDDYGRKLYLIENCLYGVDIQSIATQVSKLRFFISLVVDQDICRDRDNFGVRPLPNLEIKFVTADTLISAEKPSDLPELAELTDVQQLKDALQDIRHKIFSVKTTETKQKYKDADAAKRDEIATALKASGWPDETADRLASWNPYKQNDSTDFFDPDWMFGLQGFDVVIGNPPYIQIQKFSGQQCQRNWEAQNYVTYTKTGDLYCLFYERGYKMLKENGVLTLITSNKWMRATYGKALRTFFLSNGEIRQLIDFSDSPIFSAATTYTNILVWVKKTNPSISNCLSYDLKSVYEKQTTITDMLDMAEVSDGLFNENAFVVISSDWARINKQVKALGTPLKDWNIAINFGVKTGRNEAFIIRSKKREELIAQDPKSAEILKPILRGRDIKRYAIQFSDLWLIDAHNGYINRKGDRILPVNILRNHPSIWRHLDNVNREIDGKVQNRTDQGNHWSNLRNCAYYEEFNKEKIIYAEIVYDSAFYYETEGYTPEATSFILTGEHLKYLTALLNSKLLTEIFKRFYAGGDLRGGTFRYKKAFLELLPVKKPTAEEKSLFEQLVSMVQFAKSSNCNLSGDFSSQKTDKLVWTTFLEDLIDACVMECYFREHMAERDLLFHDDLAPHLEAYNPDASETEQTKFIEHLYNNLNAPDAVIRNRLLRICTDSPELLGVIKQEGRV